MAIDAVFGDIAVLVSERAAFLHMAARTQVPQRNTFEHPGLGRTMRVMAVKTAHFVFPDRMMGKQAELRLHIRMAAITKFSHLVSAHLLLGTFMEFVAGKTAEIVQGMDA